MEITLSSEEIAIIAIGVLILIAVVSGHIAQVRRTGKLPTRDEFNALSGEVAALKAEVATLPTQESIDAAIRESEARIIKALINHRHPEPGGAPVFIEPV